MRADSTDLAAELMDARYVPLSQIVPRELRKLLSGKVGIDAAQDQIFTYAETHPRDDGRLDCPMCRESTFAANGWTNLGTLVNHMHKECHGFEQFVRLLHSYKRTKGK